MASSALHAPAAPVGALAAAAQAPEDNNIGHVLVSVASESTGNAQACRNELFALFGIWIGWSEKGLPYSVYEAKEEELRTLARMVYVRELLKRGLTVEYGDNARGTRSVTVSCNGAKMVREVKNDGRSAARIAYVALLRKRTLTGTAWPFPERPQTDPLVCCTAATKAGPGAGGVHDSTLNVACPVVTPRQAPLRVPPPPRPEPCRVPPPPPRPETCRVPPPAPRPEPCRVPPPPPRPEPCRVPPPPPPPEPCRVPPPPPRPEPCWVPPPPPPPPPSAPLPLPGVQARAEDQAQPCRPPSPAGAHKREVKAQAKGNGKPLAEQDVGHARAPGAAALAGVGQSVGEERDAVAVASLLQLSNCAPAPSINAAQAHTSKVPLSGAARVGEGDDAVAAVSCLLGLSNCAPAPANSAAQAYASNKRQKTMWHQPTVLAPRTMVPDEGGGAGGGAAPVPMDPHDTDAVRQMLREAVLNRDINANSSKRLMALCLFLCKAEEEGLLSFKTPRDAPGDAGSVSEACILGWSKIVVSEPLRLNLLCREMVRKDAGGIWKQANGKHNQELKNPTWGVYELLRRIGVKPHLRGPREGDPTTTKIRDMFYYKEWEFKNDEAFRKARERLATGFQYNPDKGHRERKRRRVTTQAPHTP